MKSSEPNRRSELHSLQYLRASAAIAVVAFHIGELFGLKLSFGALGVDLFFVVSGFVMVLATQYKEQTPAYFLLKRIIRIVPLYWLITLTGAALALSRPNLFPNVEPQVDHVFASLFFIPHFSPAGDMFPLTGQGWTLNYEMFFYAIFGTVLFLDKRWRLISLVATILTFVVFGLLTSPQSPLLLTYTSPLLLEFLIGVLICKLWLNGWVLGKLLALTTVSIGLIASLAFHISSMQANALTVGLPMGLVVYGMICLEKEGGLPNSRSLKYLGDASYSIYLAHYLPANFVELLAAKSGWSMNLSLYLPTTLLAVGFGVLVYKFAELPITAYLSGLLSRKGAHLIIVKPQVKRLRTQKRT
ncbi:acyltransferase [Phyllobacterium sp. SB3]|uniref:acyltransferase family protein n=1 Tax=Phyllobacterium sp. SB3 TaxID=3156073 RepID=UPI0032AF078C